MNSYVASLTQKVTPAMINCRSHRHPYKTKPQNLYPISINHTIQIPKILL